MKNDPNSLLALVQEHFNRDELETLCFSLGIDYEDLPSGLSKTGEIRELILLVARRNRLNDLVVYCQKERPNVSWPNPNLTSMERLLGGPVKPPQPYEPETVPVPAGSFLMGSLPDENIPEYEQSQYEIVLPEYRIGCFPVTNAQYAEFLKRAKYPSPSGWLGSNPPKGKEQHPVVNASWFDATAYCQWLTKHTGRPYRLPTEAEWEKAARGEDGRIYPWGNDWQDDLCNHHKIGTTARDTYKKSVSPYGCQDMAGNVREWTSTIWGDDYEMSQYPYPYRVADGREDKGKDTAVFRIIRSSSFRDRPIRHRCASRAWYAPDNTNKRRGFRIVMAQSPVSD